MSRSTRRIILGVVAGVAISTVVAVATAVAASSGGVRTQARSAGSLARVNFISGCGFSHRAADDPIVFPGSPGASHDHSFVGNNSTDAFSALGSLQAASTTCRRPVDKAGYWVPTLMVDGQPVAPLNATIYYRRSTLAAVHPFPAGLKVIAGDSKATAPQSRRITFWNCGLEAGMPASATPPSCPAGRGRELRLHVTFPSCWDGVSTDSPDHRSHMAYPERRACPASHSVPVPAISLIYRYPVSGTHQIELSSHGAYSGHADFFNAWDQARLQQLVDSCLNALRHCGRGS